MTRRFEGMTLLLSALVVGLLSCCSAALVRPMDHAIAILTAQNFQRVISQFRNTQVASLLFYTKNDESKSLIDGVYDTVAKEMKQQAKIAAINCDEFRVFCQEQKVDKFPSIMIYPPNPIPAYIFTGDLTSPKALKSTIIRHIPRNHVRIVTSLAEHDKIMAENAAVPKVFLFSTKQTPTPLYHSLANQFSDRMSFVFIDMANETLATMYKVKQPTLLMVRGGPSGKPEKFNGVFEFAPMHKWLNDRSETFVKGGGFSDEGRAEDQKIWLVQKIPEVTGPSHQDICFKKQGLCVIYLADGTIPDSEIAMLEQLKSQYETGERGVNFRWMWMDITLETNFKELLGVTETPSVVAFKPHKKLKWTGLGDQKATKQSIEKLLEKILGGDARFVSVKGDKLPRFVERGDAHVKEEL
eukprot:GHVN01071039.1.p1 GENE.GHVN01071039.1~~GHVN01071039.1.p1  ORF type:complete len:412 (+),score=70.60 GHVN01071039.1:64-1299(+)